MLAPWNKSYDKPRQYVKKQRHHCASKVHISQSYGFPSNHVQKKAEPWIVLVKTLESPLDCKEIKSVNPKGNKSWIFIGRADADTLATWCEEVEKTGCSLEKTLMLGKVEGKRRRGQKKRWLDSITDSMGMNLNKLLDIVGDRGAWYATVHGVAEWDMS